MSSAELDCLLQRGAATLESASGLEVPDTPEDATEKELDAPLSSLLKVEHKGITPTKVKSLADKITLDEKKEKTWQRMLTMALRWRYNMIQAVKSEQQWRMPLLLKAARTMPVTKELLAYTGIGWLIADTRSWPVTCQLVVKDIEMKWRKAAALKSDGRSPFYGWSKVRLSKNLMPFHGEKPSHFMAKVESLANYLRNNDDELLSPAIY